MPKITPFLMFNDQAGEAMEFYTSIFPDSNIVSKMPGPDGHVAGGSFELDGQRFNCYNAGPHPNFNFSQGVSFMIYAETQDEIDHYYDKLSEGGEQLPCGWLADKFGVSWQVTPPLLMRLLSDPDREKAGRVMQAMFKMTKIIIADLEAAAASE
jgi:predicted 3-demethylubiquinone-9 3-methyltransferase (glyoxalase superfamily)